MIAHFNIEQISKLVAEIGRLRYRRCLTLADWKIGPNKGRESGRRPIRVGERWGDRDQRFWFQREISIPSEWKGETVLLRISLGDESEGLLYLDGQPVQGVDAHHDEVFLTEAACGDENYEILISERSPCMLMAAHLLRLLFRREIGGKRGTHIPFPLPSRSEKL